MTYLFGDSSPSDLDVDYIEFLREALDFSVQVLAAHERMMLGAAHAVELRREGDAEVTRLEALGAAQARAIEAFDIGNGDSPTAQCAQTLLMGAAETVRMSIERVRAAGAADVSKIEDEARRDRERCVDALAAFLKRHDLPQMSSELRLQQQAGNGYAARLYARALADLQVVIELEIAPSHLLANVVRVDKLIERLEVHAPESGGWLRKEVKLRPQRLEKEFITALVVSARETMIHLRTAADGTGVGFDLTIPADGARVSLHRVGEASEMPAFDLDETDSSKVRDFKDKLLATTVELRRARKSLVEAALGDKSLAEHRDPKIIVERLVAAMAPVVREIAKRSLAPTEFVIKRQTGDGRREEIFVSRRDLQLKLRALGPAGRAVFAALELGELPPEDAAPPKPVAKSQAVEKRAVEKVVVEKQAADKVVVEKQTADNKVAVEKTAVDEAVAERAAAEKALAEKSAAEKLAAEKSAAEKAAIEKKRATAAERSLFAEALAVDKPSSPRVTPVPPAPKDDTVRLDDSLDRLIVSEGAARKPQ